jgi:hypothetical protein
VTVCCSGASGDQPANAAKLQRAGMAKAIHHKELTAARFLPLLRELLEEPSASGYAAAAARLQDLALAHAATNKAVAGEDRELRWSIIVLPRTIGNSHGSATRLPAQYCSSSSSLRTRSSIAVRKC